jgi:signal transduction histidine kinase
VGRIGGTADVAGRQAPGYCHLVDALGPGAGAPDGGVGRDPPDQARLGQLAGEQAALRRVATLVAQATPPEEVFAAVAEEVGQLLPVDSATMCRYESDGTLTFVAHWGLAVARFPVGTRRTLGGHNLGTLVSESGRSARVDGYADSSSGALGTVVREAALHSAVGTPIIVDGRLWGLIAAGSSLKQPLPADSETRLASFTELVATAIASTDGRAALARLADEQAALRRVATLVAQATRPEQVFAAVAEEVGRHLGVDFAILVRYDPQDILEVVGTWTRTGAPAPTPVGGRLPLGGRNVTTAVYRTGRPARIDSSDVSGVIGQVASRGWGLRSSVGVPVSAEGRLWGCMVVAFSGQEQRPLSADTEARLASFTELVATAIANTQARMELRGFAEEQAALRRVATLVAAGAPPGEAFAAVAEEAGRLFLVDVANMYRYEPDGTATLVASVGGRFAVGSRLKLEGKNGVTLVYQTGRAARMESFDDASGPLGAEARQRGVRSAVATPVMVEGLLWGVLGVGTSTEQPLPPDAEARLASFAELVATAIANAESHAALTRLAEEQAALRRVATLVAQGVPPVEIFSAVSDEGARLFGAQAAVLRFEHDGPAVVFVGASKSLELPVGTRWEFQPGMASAQVYRTERSARVDAMDWPSASGLVAGAARRLGIVSSVASPVVVEGRLWGAMNVASAEELLPFGLEGRLEKFTELVATAIANAESRSELAASRRRIVTASDEARRRIERDLHDGTQQRLVSLGLAARLAQADVAAGRGDLRAELSRLAAGLADAVAELQEFSRGIHPAVLSERGLGPALRTLARRSAVPVELDVRTNARFHEPVEIAAYYVASEALANTMKHAQASHVEMLLATRDGSLLLSVRDDGLGGADPGRGSGLAGLTDRVEALGGSIHVHSAAGVGTHIKAHLPLEYEPAQGAG